MSLPVMCCLPTTVSIQSGLRTTSQTSDPHRINMSSHSISASRAAVFLRSQAKLLPKDPADSGYAGGPPPAHVLSTIPVTYPSRERIFSPHA